MTWLVERGIGETRAIRLEDGEIAEARLDWGDPLDPGMVADARLAVRRKGAARGVAEFADGSQALVDRLPASASEGAPIRLEILRPAMSERGRGKLARARPTDAKPRPAPSLAEQIEREGHAVRIVTRFPEDDWSALMLDAFSAEAQFPGGSLVFAPTPAMTLVDIDGDLSPRDLAMAACRPLARALRQFDIAGSIAIDFPTLPAKAERRAVDQELAAALGDWPHERTAMNGFGLVQIVARLERVSLLHRATLQRAGSAARLLLRRAEMLEGPGTIAMTIHPALEPHLHGEWLEELRRRTGRALRIERDPTLAIEAPHAQLVA